MSSALNLTTVRWLHDQMIVRHIHIAFAIAASFLEARVAAETWVPVRATIVTPIDYLVDIDGIDVSGDRRSIRAKWVLGPGIYQLGSWQFDCRSQTWRGGEAATIVRSGAAAKTVSLSQAWRGAKAGSVTEKLLSALCASSSRDGLAQKLQYLPTASDGR